MYKSYEPLEFREALQKCQNEGGNLPQPMNEKENDGLVDFLKEKKLTSAWLSISNSHSGYFSQVLNSIIEQLGSNQYLLVFLGCINYVLTIL